MLNSQVGRTVLVLGGGGTMGAFQAGSLRALAEAGVLPDRLVGCSAGSLNAAFLAVDPSAARAAQLCDFWLDPSTRAVLAPEGWAKARSFASLVTSRGQAFLDPGPLRRLIARHIPAHDAGELAVPLAVTTTCLECARAVHHTRGPLPDVLMASCALPGLLPPVRLADGHTHVDGGVVCGVPVGAAVAAAGPEDRVLVLDCGFAPVTCRDVSGCSLGGERKYVAPSEPVRGGALDVTMRSFTVARGEANRASVEAPLRDPRVRVLPHVSDAYAAGLVEEVPRSPRDFGRSAELVEAGAAATRAWLTAGGLSPALPHQRLEVR